MLDFGLAKEAEGDHPRLTRPGTLSGTPTYMAPEQIATAAGDLFSGRERLRELLVPLDGKVDLYAAGVVFYQILCGRPPFTGRMVDVLRSHLFTAPPDLPALVPAPVRDLCMKLLQKRPADRFGSAKELLQAIRGSRMETSEERGESISILIEPEEVMEVGRRLQGGWRGRAAWMAMSLACSLAPSGVAFDRRPLVGLAVPTYDMTTTTTPDAPKGKEGPLNNRRSRDVPPLRLARVVNPVTGSPRPTPAAQPTPSGQDHKATHFQRTRAEYLAFAQEYGLRWKRNGRICFSRWRWAIETAASAPSPRACTFGCRRFDRNSVVWKQMEARRWARERPNQSGQRDEWGQVQLQCHSTAPWGPGRCSAPGQTAAMPAQDSVRSPITRGLRRRTEEF